MSDDKSDKAGGWFGNPLPIVMVVLLAAGVLVKNVPLESARPTDPERVKFVPTSQQDVEARLWQDPFAAVEKHEKISDQAVTPTENILMKLSTPYVYKPPPAPHTPDTLHEDIEYLHDKMTVVAVSVFGGSYAEAAESRRRSRFAVVSALGFHDYHPENAEALGYFHINLSKSEPNAGKLTVPYEWFEKEDKSHSVLVLWLNEDKLSPARPLNELHSLINELTPPNLTGSLRVKLIGPAGSAMLGDLVRESTDPKQKLMALKIGSTIDVFSPSATISSCDLNTSGASEGMPPWNCFMIPSQLKKPTTLPIIRTTGTDDVLAAALLWELWQRGVNHDSWLEQTWANIVKALGDTSPRRECEDGLVLIGELDTAYGRTLLRYLNDGFSGRCGANLDGKFVTLRSDKPPVRTFTYLRGLDGVLPDIDKSGSKPSSKDDSSKSKDLRAQLEDVPPEHAEGRSQFDYLRRLADEIEQLDQKKQFAENGVKAIGIVGSDLYDKLIILQALRSRFKDKIFFTTDLDARYLHADQKDWARNLVVASNFGLSLHPALQRSTLPFRDSYQTSTYLATLMALNPLFDWTSKMQEWLRPHIFEIGRTEAVHLASPPAEHLRQWIESDYTNDIADTAKDTKCTRDLAKCENIEPNWPSRSLSLEHLSEILIMLCLGIFLVALANRRVNETVRTAFDASSPERNTARTIIYSVIGAIAVVLIILAIVWILMEDSLAQGVGEPFVWLEGVSVWPSLVVRFIGLATMFVLWYAFLKMIQQKEKPDEDFEIALPKIRKLNRTKMSAWLKGPHLKLALFDKEGNAEVSSAVTEESTGKEVIDVTTLWQNYLLATSWREMAGWIFSSMLLVGGLGVAAYFAFGKASFPHRGQLVVTLHYILILLNGTLLWLVIFWVGYETRACVRFIQTLSGARSLWSPVLLDHEEASTGVPRGHLDDYLDFKLIVHATQRIHWLIYLPFAGILFMVLSRSNFFDTMDFPLALVFVTGLALTYALYSAVLLRRSAESARATALEHYEARLLAQSRAKDSLPPAIADGAANSLARQPISVEQIKILMEHIRNTREGAFAPFAQQPALQALLLPFGGYGSVQLIEYLFKL